jgi:putative transposase
MGRGIEQQKIFLGDADREDFLRRVEDLSEKKAWVVYAWALMPNHFHLLVRTGTVPLSKNMRSLMSGYAGYFNRTHKRVGHVFQNRFKSVLCEEDPYFLELVRYIHLNPLRAGLVKTIGELDKSPLTCHSRVINGPLTSGSQEILERFSKNYSKARSAYREFVKGGLDFPEPNNLEGGGLVRSAGGWGTVKSLRRGREKYLSDERILGGTGFVKALVQEAEKSEEEKSALSKRWSLATLVKKVCDGQGIEQVALNGSGKSPSVSMAREGISFLWTKKLGQNGRELMRVLGIKPSTVYQAARRGEQRAEEWTTLLREP